MDKLRAVAYIRVSSKSKAQIHSFEFQSDYWCQAFANDEKYSFCGIYADKGISGKSAFKRKEFLQMIEDGKAGKFDIVFTKSVQRFGRDTADILKAVRELRDAGVRVYFEKERIDSGQPTSELYLQVAAAISENDLKVYSNNQRWSIREKYANGYVSIGKGIFGYTMNTETNTLEIIPDQAETIRMAFGYYLAGRGFGGIAEKLEAEGRKNYHGIVKWDDRVIREILVNEKHKGCSLSQKDVYDQGVRKCNNGIAKQYYMENVHEAIVSPETFDKVQALIKQRAEHFKSDGQKNEYAFTGLIYCGVCGHKYKHKIQNAGTDWRTGIWICTYQNTRGKAVCDSIRIKDSVLREKFVECYNEYISKGYKGEELSELTIAREKLIREHGELQMLYMDNLIAPDAFKAEEQKFRVDLDRVSMEINQQEIRTLKKSDYCQIEQFEEEKVNKFLKKVTICKNVVTFTFIQGVELSRRYDNGPAGNQKGWMDKKFEKTYAWMKLN